MHESVILMLLIYFRFDCSSSRFFCSPAVVLYVECPECNFWHVDITSCCWVVCVVVTLCQLLKTHGKAARSILIKFIHKFWARRVFDDVSSDFNHEPAAERKLFLFGFRVWWAISNRKWTASEVLTPSIARKTCYFCSVSTDTLRTDPGELTSPCWSASVDTISLNVLYSFKTVWYNSYSKYCLWNTKTCTESSGNKLVRFFIVNFSIRGHTQAFVKCSSHYAICIKANRVCIGNFLCFLIVVGFESRRNNNLDVEVFKIFLSLHVARVA